MLAFIRCLRKSNDRCFNRSSSRGSSSADSSDWLTGNGNFCVAGFNIASFVHETSIAPVAISGLTISSGRCLTVPSTVMTHSPRALLESGKATGSQTT